MDEYKMKIIFVGDSGVGKTNLIESFINKTFNESHNITLGLEYYSKTISLSDGEYLLQLWDTGLERFYSL